MRKPLEMNEILNDIRTRPTVPVWPHAGQALSLSKAQSYAAAREGLLEVIRVGTSVRALSAPLRKLSGMEAA